MAKQQLWHWRGIAHDGQPCEGKLWAVRRTDMLLHLQQNSICPLAIRRLPVRHWSVRQRIHFIRQLATLLQAGIPLTEGLLLLAQQHPQPQWQALASHLAGRLHEGVTFAAAISQWPFVFPPLFAALLHTGELTGRLDECCQQLASQQEQQLLLQQKVGKALRYPALILLLAVLVTIGMLGFVLPEFAAIYQSFDAPLPLLTQSVMALSGLITRHTLAVTTLFLSVIIAAIALHKHPASRITWQKILLHTPLLKTLIRAQRLSQIYTVLALCQQTGLPLLQALDNVISTQPCPVCQKTLRYVRQQISEGVPFCQAIAQQPLFSGLCRQLIRTGELTGTLDLMLQRLAHWHSEQARQRADQLASALEPAMMLIIGGIIGTLVLAMYLPVFQLGDIIGAG